MICDHCLAPDTSGGAGIGCDNMTILIVAILNGRTKKQWYAWVKKRVKKNYGYTTPSSLPTLYSASQLTSFRARREAQERSREQQSRQSRVLEKNGSVSSEKGIANNDSAPVSGSNDSEDDDNEDEENDKDDETNESSSPPRQTLGLGHPDPPDTRNATKRLKAQLDEKGIRQKDDKGETWMHGGALRLGWLTLTGKRRSVR